MIARATVSPPTPESNTPIARSSLMPSGLPPQRLRDLLLRAFELRRPRLRGEVLPSAVGKETDDVRAIEVRGDPSRNVHDRARGDAGEDALLLGEVAVLVKCVGG